LCGFVALLKTTRRLETTAPPIGDNQVEPGDSALIDDPAPGRRKSGSRFAKAARASQTQSLYALSASAGAVGWTAELDWFAIYFAGE